MDLVEAPCGLPVWLKVSIRVIRVSENIRRGAITRDQRIFFFEERLFTF